MACVTRVPAVDGMVGPSRTSGNCNSRSSSYRPYPSPSTSSSRSFTPGLQRQRDVMGAPPQFVDSPCGALRVFAYSPPQGPPGATITANIDFTMQAADTIYLRLVLGRRALTTSVRRLPDRRFELQARVPLDDAAASPTSVMSLSAQALSSNDELIDTVTFGNFTMMDFATSYSPPIAGYMSHEDTLDSSIAPIVRPSGRRDYREGSSMEIYPSDHYMQDFGCVRTARPSKKTSLIRTRRTVSGDDDSGAKCASLVLETEIESMSKDWEKEELSAGRRLVRFSRLQEGSTLKVSCATVKQDDYVEGDAVVSCIYRKDTNSCFVTSVDIILLLERLVGQEFDIEEKNRIRRNLEGFRPKTISKNRSESSEFFLQIMNFPSPKPRNIEKDLKVFDWAILAQALDKIISRYTLPFPQPRSRIHTPDHSVPSSVPTGSVSPLLPPTSRTHSPADYSPHSNRCNPTPEFPSDVYGSSPAAGSFPYVPPHDRAAPSLLPGDVSSSSYDDPGFYDSFSYSSGSTASTPMVATPSCSDPQATFGVDVPEKAFMAYSSYPSSSDVLGGSQSVRSDYIGLDNGALSSSFHSVNFDTMNQVHRSPIPSPESYL
ncbi:uncharacterized protein C8Q71DRAFT_862207 [Rhodofomes roseus]|uniref:DUF7082 domain-containing protein n=1 Tax=Rhodofomes roseus TaxID=34475 RepID=A0ABQ8K212_9APHY|nr:uncharacterized protein C8Q71DRAFT_862207 [Rhodofomes roseus]KAH9830754.1 hypothetical protein C8Q71DRAFT_862207 [Rhodofomes roseus]